MIVLLMLLMASLVTVTVMLIEASTQKQTQQVPLYIWQHSLKDSQDYASRK